jgi:hypothetical protein
MFPDWPMSLIYLTREFVSGSVSFNGLPDFDNGFVRLNISLMIDALSGHELRLFINGGGPEHVTQIDPMPAGWSSDGNYMLLARSGGGGAARTLFTCDALFSFVTGGSFVNVQALTSANYISPQNQALPPSSWQAAGGRKVFSLNSIRVETERFAGTGIARLFVYKHIPDLQLEI